MWGQNAVGAEKRLGVEGGGKKVAWGGDHGVRIHPLKCVEP